MKKYYYNANDDDNWFQRWPITYWADLINKYFQVRYLSNSLPIQNLCLNLYFNFGYKILIISKFVI